MTERPVFVASPPPDKFWRQYRIYLDRVELETVLGVMTIPFDEIEQVGPVAGAAAEAPGGEGLVIDRKHGWVRRVCIRPTEPVGFRQALETALTRHRARLPEH